MLAYFSRARRLGGNVRGSDCDLDSGCVSTDGEGERQVGDEVVETFRSANWLKVGYVGIS